MKIQYGFYLFIRKYQNNYMPQCEYIFASPFLWYIEMTDRSMYNFSIVVLYTQFKVCFQNNRPS